MILLSLTSGYHKVFRFDYGLLEGRRFTMVTFRNGPLFWIYALYSYASAIATGYLLQRNFRTHNIIKRRQAVLISLAIVLFIVVDILYQMGITPIRGYTLSPAALCVSGIMMGVAVFYYRLLDLAPITRAMVMNGIADIIFVVDEDGRVIECNRAAAATFGIRAEHAEGAFLAAVHPELALIADAEGRTATRKLLIRGSEREFEAKSEPVLFAGKYPVARLIHLRDVTEQNAMAAEIRAANQSLTARLAQIEQLQEQLRDQAIRDPLTGAYNRRYLDEALERDFAFMKRNGRPMAFAMLDIDHFKQINDTWEHQAGDAVLRQLAELLRSAVRRSDIVCRYGGEEFLVLLNGAGMEQAFIIIDGIREAFGAAGIAYGGFEIKATLSGGLAVYPEGGEQPWDLIRKSDEALYHAKDVGRNRIVRDGA